MTNTNKKTLKNKKTLVSKNETGITPIETKIEKKLSTIDKLAIVGNNKLDVIGAANIGTITNRQNAYIMALAAMFNVEKNVDTKIFAKYYNKLASFLKFNPNFANAKTGEPLASFPCNDKKSLESLEAIGLLKIDRAGDFKTYQLTSELIDLGNALIKKNNFSL
jgi:NADH dehydrogenase/NADH:ubiquinone oxidoreductase subunit G